MASNNNNHSNNERIYVLGATGNVGSVIVDELLKNNNVQVTAYTRSPNKLVDKKSKSKDDEQLTIVQGEYTDLTSFYESIAGHTRLFLLVPDMEAMGNIKVELGKKAIEAGVKQIVDLSVANTTWRQYQALLPHQEAEKVIFELPNRRNRNTHFVSLRPTNFMSNLFFSAETIKNQDMFMDAAEPNHEYQDYISPRDIGQVASRILMDPVERHGDAAYELVGDVKTPQERAGIFSTVLGRPIRYTQVSAQTMYDSYIKLGVDHALSFCASTYQAKDPVITRGLPILLGGRNPESIQEWLENNKKAFM